MKVHGSCHCGQIAYEAEVNPDKVNVCNCRDCQMLSGSGWRVSVQAPVETFRLLSGKPKVYVKTADSGTKRRHAFCGNCGTPVSSSADSDQPPFYSLRIGCLKERDQLAPKRQIWLRSKLPWAQDVSSVPGIEGQ